MSDEDESDRRQRYERFVPEWAEQDSYEWKNARDGWAVILLGGSPIWQTLLWYLDWGSGIGGYVPNFKPVFGDDDEELGGGAKKIDRWETTRWEIGLAGLINELSNAGREFASFDLTSRVAPEPLDVHPIDAERMGH